MKAAVYWYFLAVTCIGRSTAGLTEEVEELLNAGDQLEFNGATDLIIILGSTGVGKSTLAKFITKNPSLQVIKSGHSYVFIDNGTISTVTSKSMTLLPNVYRDEETGQILVDCPGFSDTREPKFEIAASFFIKKVMEYAKRVKIILAENHFSLMDGADRFGLKRLLKHVSELMPNVNHFRGSMVLIATKVINQGLTDEEEKSDIMSFISNFAGDLRNDISSHQSNASFQRNTGNLLRALNVINNIGSGTNLALFRRPIEGGSPWESTNLARCYSYIRDLIFQRMPWLDNSNQRYHYTLSTDSIVFIKENLVPNNNKNVMAELTTIVDLFIAGADVNITDSKLSVVEKIQIINGLQNNFVNTVKNMRILPDLSNVGIELSKIMDLPNIDYSQMPKLVFKTQFFNDVGGIDSNIFLTEAKKRLSRAETALESKKIFYKFLQDVEVQLDTFGPQSVRHTSIKQVLKSELKNFIFEASKQNIALENKEQLLTLPVTDYMVNDLNRILHAALAYPINIVHNQQTKHLLVEARNVFASDVNAKLGAYPGLTSLTIIAAKNVFLEENLMIVKTHVNIIAPKVQVIGTREINLKGSNAGPFPGKAANSHSFGVPGADGHAGYPGGNAGNFVLVALNVIDPSKLTVKSFGGNGGRGQDGGNGRVGVASSYPPIVDIIMDTPQDVESFIHSQGFDLDINGNHIIVINQKENVKPSRGGTGGVGGPGGRAGNIFIKVQNQTSGAPIKLVQRAGNQGEGGDGGVGGVGLSKCARKHFLCNIYEERGPSDIWQMRTTRIISKDYRCVPTKLDNCDKNPDAAGGGKGGSAIGLQDSYQLVQIFFDQLWHSMNERVAPYQPIGDDYKDLHQYAQKVVNKN
jgi:GTP-binding protein EngB required for normal cell division